MEDEPDESIWRARLKWRLRGAWQGPAFVVTTLVGAVMLNRLPVAGDKGLDLIGGVLLCGFLNLAIAGFLAPVAARVLRRRRPSPVPLTVRQDRIGTRLMLGLSAVLLVMGLTHRASVQASQRDYAKQLLAVRAYVAHQAPREYLAGIGSEDVWKQKDGFYRTCVPGPDPRRSLCLYVSTEGTATVTRDPDQQSNARIAGPDNPSRRGG